MRPVGRRVVAKKTVPPPVVLGLLLAVQDSTSGPTRNQQSRAGISQVLYSQTRQDKPSRIEEVHQLTAVERLASGGKCG